MVHPTFAQERHPDFPPTDGENRSGASRVDLAVLRRQVFVHKAAMTEAQDAASCLHDLLLGARRLDGGEFAIGAAELQTLVGLINAQFQRRMEAALAAALKMQDIEQRQPH